MKKFKWIYSKEIIAQNNNNKEKYKKTIYDAMESEQIKTDKITDQIFDECYEKSFNNNDIDVEKMIKCLSNKMNLVNAEEGLTKATELIDAIKKELLKDFSTDLPVNI